MHNIVVRKTSGILSNGSRMCDHKYLHVTFKLSKTNKRPDFWKFNTFYLDDDKYNEEIVNLPKLPNNTEIF